MQEMRRSDLRVELSNAEVPPKISGVFFQSYPIEDDLHVTGPGGGQWRIAT